MRATIDTQTRRQLESIARGLPRDFDARPGKTLWPGSDLLLTPIGKTKGGTPIDPNKLYEIDCPIFVERDHFKNLLSVYRRGGVRAVNKYVDELAERDIVVVEVENL